MLLAAAPAQTDSRQVLLDAMSSELSRNQQQLKLQSHEPPYFMSYQLKDYEQEVVAARFGAIFMDDGYRERRLYVDARVGDYAFDSSVAEGLEFSFSTKGTSYTARKEGPLDDSPLALRTSLWLLTDEKYKSALFQFLKKKGEDVYSVEDPKRPASFTKEKPSTFVQPPVARPFDRARWVKVAREVSAQFNAHPELFDSEVRITADKVTRLFVSTEGTRLVTEETLYGLHVSAVTRAPDGQLLDDSRDFYAPTEAGLPDDERIRQSAAKVIEELLALRQAPAIDPYTGPAILAPEASGVLFHETVGHRLEGDRQDGDNEGKTFKGQVGKLVLPSFLSIHDDPSQRSLAGEPLNGYYLYDEEGVKGQRVTLVEKGVLRNYLLGRRPVEGFLRSNGHGRSQGTLKPVARMANLMVESTRQVSDEKLKQMLIDEAKKQGKPYGLIIRDITGGNTNTSSYGYQAFKGVPRMVYRVDVKTGKETLVRGVEIVGTPLSAVNRIIATGQKRGIFNGFCGAESGNVPVSTVAPAALLQEIELQRAVEGKDRPPLLPSPAAQQAPPPVQKP
ncbi:TldD/PmbA family protein [Myxococcus sp. MISCRS1]|uniref:TldD/PmbA family protein n=1 Tax=Myxococcus sp. MISCRS1 TaxID=2996786 RepID=UPI00226E5B2E|nr:TldD/PmbA family protein [Myxococcus sp. MISCRS1]MCY0996392.1 TldD/PmbA family protein [Myxococcus sp. MISCRS1]BDT33589.1 TldD/PmbA family protein [Myxococcus sp. MH1]